VLFSRSKLDLCIDGQQLPAVKASFLFQADPYPDGHKYSTLVSEKRLKKLFDYLPIRKSENISVMLPEVSLSLCSFVEFFHLKNR
jgi:hypothetical protein